MNGMVHHDAGAADGRLVVTLIDRFFAARRSLKDSPHTTAAYRRDLAAITSVLATAAGMDPSGVTADQLSARAVRDAFGDFSSGHAKTSISRCWSAWNQFFTFLVGEGVLPGNPMAAVPRPRRVRSAPKPLQGEDTPETLLRSARSPAPAPGTPGPNATWRSWPRCCSAACAPPSCSPSRSAR